MSHRVAFYPCCCLDIVEPLELLVPHADEVIFCDIDSRIVSDQQRRVAQRLDSYPIASLRTGDAREVVINIPQIDVLFYRGDSVGEGGSGLFVLGDSFLPLILKRFPETGGLIISDGSNSRGSNFKRMIRANGLSKHGWHFKKELVQPLLESHGLYIIQVQREN